MICVVRVNTGELKGGLIIVLLINCIVALEMTFA